MYSIVLTDVRGESQTISDLSREQARLVFYTLVLAGVHCHVDVLSEIDGSRTVAMAVAGGHVKFQPRAWGG